MIISQNALPPMLFEELQNEIFDNYFPWYYGKITGEYDDPKNVNIYYFSHRIIEDGQIISPAYGSLFKCCLINILDRVDLKLDRICRCRTNLEIIKPTKYEHTPHIDEERDHWSAILYMNDSDGDTIFYNQRFEREKGLEWGEYMNTIDKFTIEHTVSPVANKAVLFDGMQYHSSFTPVNTHRRVIVNFNFTIK